MDAVMHHIRSIVMIGREDPRTVGAVREPPLRMHRIQPIAISSIELPTAS
jgi:hypothetical protein